MPADKTKTTAKKAARASATPAAAKAPKKKVARKAPAKQPGLGKTVNLGPERGGNSWPASNKKQPNHSSRAP